MGSCRDCLSREGIRGVPVASLPSAKTPSKTMDRFLFPTEGTRRIVLSSYHDVSMISDHLQSAANTWDGDAAAVLNKQAAKLLDDDGCSHTVAPPTALQKFVSKYKDWHDSQRQRRIGEPFTSGASGSNVLESSPAKIWGRAASNFLLAQEDAPVDFRRGPFDGAQQDRRWRQQAGQADRRESIFTEGGRGLEATDKDKLWIETYRRGIPAQKIHHKRKRPQRPASSGHDRCYRALRPFRLCEAPAGLSLSSQRERLQLSNSGVYATMLACNCVLSLPHQDIETSVRFHSNMQGHALLDASVLCFFPLLVKLPLPYNQCFILSCPTH